MFKKELREIWKPAIFRFSVVLAVPVIMTVMAAMKRESLFPSLVLAAFPVGMIWIANFLGVTAFKAEFEDRALEYWLTFPGGISNRLARKMASRITLILLISFFYFALFIFAGSRVSSPFNPALICPLSVLFFINGILCGFLNNRNLRMVANVVTFFSALVLSLGLSRFIFPLLPEGNQLSAVVVSISALLLVIGIMGGVFLISARQFDLRSPELFQKRVRAFGLPLILALDIAALVFRYAGGRI